MAKLNIRKGARGLGWYAGACFWIVVAFGFVSRLPAQTDALAEYGASASGEISGENTTSGGTPSGGLGGGANADFESLIDLIQSTVATDSWAENGGGTGEIREFPGGVFVDAGGTLRALTLPARLQQTTRKASSDELQRRRGALPLSVKQGYVAGDPRQPSALRYVSLPRLEREITRRQDARLPLDAAMLTLAGLQRVQYVFLYPDSGDLVLAGPAGDWYVDQSGALLSVDTDQPVVRLDDLLVLLRRGQQSADSPFGCSITPRQEALAATQAFLDATSGTPLEPGQRQPWLRQLRDTLGQQNIEIFGVDPTSRVARILVEADYHMKLIGMGLAEGVDGVESYLDSIQLAPGEAAPPMSVLRWWFTQHYAGIRTTEAGDAYELLGQGVRVLSENELLAEQGRRVHTGQSEPLNRQFAERFTTHFAELSRKYPIHGELRNIFDLALVAALIQADGLAGRVDWHPTRLVDAERLRLPAAPVPRQVETVVNYRVMNRRLIIAGISGGVRVALADMVQKPRDIVQTGALVEDRGAGPRGLESGTWWWDQGLN